MDFRRNMPTWVMFSPYEETDFQGVIMVKAIRSLAVSAFAVIAICVVGAALVLATQTWECSCANEECGECTVVADEWREFHAIAAAEYAAEFTAIFDAVEFKVSKNGRSMVKGIHSASFKFAKSGK